MSCQAIISNSCFAFLLLFAQTGVSQPSEYRCERLALENGLSHNAVSAIVQDKQGFLWFGTQDGLNRYDGVRFTVFRGNVRDSLSLPTSNIRNLHADRKGNVWVSTFNLGLHRYDPESGYFRHYTHNPNDDRSISSNNIESVYEDRQGTIWVGTDKGVNKLDPLSGQCERYVIPNTRPPQDERTFITAFHDDAHGRLWIAHADGIAALDFATGAIQHVVQIGAYVRWITGDQSGTVWAGTAREVLRYDRQRQSLVPTEQQHKFRYESLFTTLMDGNGMLWSNTPQGLYRNDPRNGSRVLFPLDSTGAVLKHYSIRSVCVDRSGIAWFASYNGIYKFFPAVRHFNLVRFKLEGEGRIDQNNVRSFSEDRTGNIWIATLDGLFRFNPRTKESIFYARRLPGLSAIAGTAHWSVLWDSTSAVATILAGTNKLVFPPGRDIRSPVISRIYPELERFKNVQGYVVDALFQDRLGTIWVGFRSAGLAHYDPRRGIAKQYLPDAANPKRLNSGAVFALHETGDGSVWVATNGGGLNRFDRRTEEFTRYLSNPLDVNSIGDNGVLSLLPDEAGVLWVGTYAGLDRFDTQRGTFRRYTMENGLANNVIYGILKDDHGNLWLSSNFGITRFNPETGMVKNYDLDDGVQDYEFNHNACLKASSGEMYFGGINGFNMFHPDSMKDNPNQPNVVLVDVKILNKSVAPGPGETRMLRPAPLTQELFLGYEDAAMMFEFAALEFTDPSLNQYAYMLEGFDHEWQYVGTKREATYTNLDPGTYTLRAKASNNDGVWNEAGTAIIIHLAPPWWMTWWFRGMVAVIFLSAGPLIYYRRI
ncbi:MAG TPA: two-component regulator propeller domain-containing protein, partial [Bacteroidota bacterium]